MACRRVAFEWTGQKLSWRIQCTSPVAMDNSGTFLIDSPRHYTAVLTVWTKMNGQEMISRTVLEGERVGDCPK